MLIESMTTPEYGNNTYYQERVLFSLTTLLLNTKVGVGLMTRGLSVISEQTRRLDIVRR